MRVKHSRLVITVPVLLLVLGAAFYSIGAGDSRAVSIGFLGYSTKGSGEVWAVFAVTNRTRFDYHCSVVAEPDVVNGLWGNTPVMAPAGTVVRGEIWISKQHTPYQLVMHGHQMPVFPSNCLGTPGASLKCAWRFLAGRTRIDLMRGTIVPGTNVALTVRSVIIAPERTD
jgi:hypothetical protein